MRNSLSFSTMVTRFVRVSFCLLEGVGSCLLEGVGLCLLDLLTIVLEGVEGLELPDLVLSVLVPDLVVVLGLVGCGVVLFMLELLFMVSGVRIGYLF